MTDPTTLPSPGTPPEMEHRHDFYVCSVCRRMYRECRCPPAFTPGEREAVIHSVIGSEALAGCTMPRDVAERALDEVEHEPLPEIGGR